MDTTLLIGIVGTSLILIAFFFIQTKRWTADDFKYDLFNSIGSLLMVIYALLLESIPFLILNTVWALVSFRDVAEHVFKKKA